MEVFEKKYDYIIAGAGCAGLSLALHIIHSGKFAGKKVLLIDQDLKRANDRTWCFWEKGNGLFESIVYRQWQKLWFHGDDFSIRPDIFPYWYKMIRGIDFYDHCFATIRQHKNFDVLFGNIQQLAGEGRAGVVVNGKTVYADYVFNSILFEEPQLSSNQVWLLQHFKGWLIETGEVFDSDSATLMDFRVDQDSGTAFCYALPFHSKQALVEYTVFSAELQEQDQYDHQLACYIENVLKIKSYTIREKEFGVIPMTSYRFPQHQKRIVNIGTAGGQTKGSSGYTFQFIQKHSSALVDTLIRTGEPFVKGEPKRFDFYDRVLLHVLKEGLVPGKNIFTDLFKKNPIEKVLKFLDNETSFAEEVRIISSLPTLPFLKAGIRQMI